MNLFSKDVFFCLDFELSRFNEAFTNPESLNRVSILIVEDKEDVWFDLYRTFTSSKELAEWQVDK